MTISQHALPAYLVACSIRLYLYTQNGQQKTHYILEVEIFARFKILFHVKYISIWSAALEKITVISYY